MNNYISPTLCEKTAWYHFNFNWEWQFQGRGILEMWFFFFVLWKFKGGKWSFMKWCVTTAVSFEKHMGRGLWASRRERWLLLWLVCCYFYMKRVSNLRNSRVKASGLDVTRLPGNTSISVQICLSKQKTNILIIFLKEQILESSFPVMRSYVMMFLLFKSNKCSKYSIDIYGCSQHCRHNINWDQDLGG